jgi:hypothetical protein
LVEGVMASRASQAASMIPARSAEVMERPG